MRRVVVTGLGVVAPNGIGKKAFWSACLNGRSGVRPIRSFDASSHPIKIAAEVYGFDVSPYLVNGHKKSVKVMSRAMQGIITGIGFLGAGVILRDTSGARVHGLTTAATIWLTATLGILCGAGIWSVALPGVGLTLVILILGRPLERFLHRRFPELSDHDHDNGTPPR